MTDQEKIEKALHLIDELLKDYKLIEIIIKLKQKVDLLIVDDNSPDGTSVIIEKLKY